MVKTDYRDLYESDPSRDDALQSPPSPSDLVASSENGMDTTNNSATPGSGGSDIGSSSSDGNGSRSVDTSSRRCLVPSSPTGTQLISEFNGAADAGGSGSSSSPSSSGDQLHRLILIPTVDSALAMDQVLIIEGLFLGNEQGSSSGTTHSASPVDNNGLGTASSARGSTSTSTSFVDNNGARNRVSISDITLVSSASEGASGAGSGGRRDASNNGQFTQRREENRGMQAPWGRHFALGSSSRQQGQGAGSSNIHHHPGPEFTFPNFRPGPGFRYPPNVNFELGPEYAFPGGSPPPPLLPPWMPPGHGLTLGMELPVYLAGYNIPSSPPVIMRPPPGIYALPRVTIRRPSGLYPPPGITIRAPSTREGAPSLPEQTAPSRVRVTITAPPPREGGASASKEPEPTPPTPKPKPEEPETQSPQVAPPRATFVWPPTADEDASITQTLYGPSTSGRPRLPVFQDICPDDETSSPPSPPPPPPRP